MRTRCSSSVAQLAIANTRPGIAAENLSRIEDRFYRVDMARSPACGDSGLGLAIVKSIAEAHGGSALVASIEGPGIKFTISLPLAGDLIGGTFSATPS